MKNKKIVAGIITAALVLSVTTQAFAAEPQEMPGSYSSEISDEVSSEILGEPPRDKPGEPPSDNPGGSPGNNPGGSQPSAGNVSWSGATTITSSTTEDEKIYNSSVADENALLIDTADNVIITNPTVSKTGGTSASDNYSFYGINSGIMVKGGANVTITGGTVNTDAEGANGVFSYGANNGQTNAAGDGTIVNISETVITTTGNGSGGIMTTYGGTTVAKNLTIKTSGRSSAPIRTDRGGGLVTVDGGTYISDGQGSPAIYSTADIKVSGAALTSNKSEGVVIEGTGSVSLTNCDLTADNTALNGNAQFYDTVMIYQSMSGDASSGTSAFSMTGGSLTSKSGDTFHVTNTECTIDLTDVSITNSSDGALISVCDDGWSGGSNKASLSASNQILTGDILVGDDSEINLILSDRSVLTGRTSGTITNDKGSVVSTEIGTVNVTLEEGTLWVLTGDSYVTGLSGSGKINYNGHTLYLNGTAYSSGSIGSISETTETSSDSPEPAKTIVISPSSAIIEVGRSVTFTAETTKSGAEVVWSTSDEKIAVVNNGVVTGISSGEAVITASYGSTTATAAVSVVEHADNPDKTIKIGKKIKIETDKKVKRVRVSDKGIVKATKSGKKIIVKGKKAGIVTITAYDKKGAEIGSWIVKVE